MARTSRRKTGPRKALGPTHGAAIKAAQDLLRRWGAQGYRVKFSARQTRAMGKCNYRDRMITLSTALWPRATAEERMQTIIHEVAHAVVGEVYGWQYAVRRGHGAEWKATMRAMGAPPHRTHSVSRVGLERQRRDTIAIVCCGQTVRITIKRLRRGVRCKCGRAWAFATKQDQQAFSAATVTPNRVCLM